MIVTFELADSLHPQKYFFSSPQGCVGVIIILQKVPSNSHEFVCFQNVQIGCSAFTDSFDLSRVMYVNGLQIILIIDESFSP